MIIAILLLVALSVVVVNILLYFGNWRTYPWYVQATCFIAWLFPFSIIVMLPLDLASTLYRNCEGPDCKEPFAYVDESFLLTFWQIVYWTMFNLTWYFIPVMQSWVRSGDFHPWPRFYNAVKENIIYYAILGVIGLAFLIYIIFSMKFNERKLEDLMDFLMAGANAWGLLLSTAMLGYGFVEIPRRLWWTSDPRWELKFLECKAPRTKEQVVDSEAELYDIAKDVAIAGRKIGPNDPLRVYLDKLLEKCPLAMDERVTDEDRGRDKEITLDTLKALHARINYTHTVHERHQAQYRFLLERAWLLGDVIDNERNRERSFKSPLMKPPRDQMDRVKLQALWWWYVWIRPYGMKIVSVLCIIASVALVWSESTFQIKSAAISIPALILDLKLSYAALELISVMFLLYMCAAAYSVMFQLKILDYYVMVPDHHTDENSLLFVGAYLCRLTFPLCYNFLNMAGLAEDDQSSAFVQVQGKAAQLAPLIGTQFAEWVPQLVLVFSLITLLNLYPRLMGLFRIKTTFYEQVARTGTSDEDLEEGRKIIGQERATEERRIARGGDPGQLSLLDSGRGRNTGSVGGGRLGTKELLDKYNQRRGGGSSSGQNAASSSSSGQRGRFEEAIDSGRASPVLTGSVPNGNSFSLKHSFFGTKNAGKSTAASGGGAGNFQRLDDSGAGSSGRETSPGARRKFGKGVGDDGGSTPANTRSPNPIFGTLLGNASPASPASSTGGSRAFGASGVADNRSPSPNPAAQQQQPKRNTRNIFDDAASAASAAAVGTVTVPIGVVLPYGEPFINVSARRVLEMTVQDVNSDPTYWIPGVKFNLTWRDSKGSVAPTVAAAIDLATNEGVVGIIGEYSSGNTGPMILSLNFFNVFSGGVSTSPYLSDRTQYMDFFRTAPSDALQGARVADLVHMYGWSQIGMVVVNSNYGLGLSQYLIARAQQLNITILAQEAYYSASTLTVDDFSNQVLALKEADVRVIVVVGYDYDTIMLLRAARLQGLIGPDYVWIGTDAVFPIYEEVFVSAYDSDCLLVMVEGVRTLRSLGHSMESILSRTTGENVTTFTKTDFMGSTGPIQFDGHGDRPGKYQVSNIQRGGQLANIMIADVDGNFEMQEPVAFFDGTANIPPDRTPLTRDIIESNSALGIIIYGLYAVGACGCVAACAVLVVMRVTPPVKTMSLPFLLISGLGLLLEYTTVLTWIGHVESKKSLCIAQQWLGWIGFSIVMQGILPKCWRVFRIFDNKQMGSNSRFLQDPYLLAMSTPITLVNVVLLLAWTIQDPLTPTKVVDLNSNHYRYECQSTSTNVQLGYNIALMIYNGSLLAATIALAYVTRNVASAYRETTFLLYSAQNVFICSVVVLALIYSSGSSFTATLILRVILTFVATTIVGVMTVGRVAMAAVWGRDNDVVVKTTNNRSMISSISSVCGSPDGKDDGENINVAVKKHGESEFIVPVKDGANFFSLWEKRKILFTPSTKVFNILPLPEKGGIGESFLVTGGAIFSESKLANCMEIRIGNILRLLQFPLASDLEAFLAIVNSVKAGTYVKRAFPNPGSPLLTAELY
ncbi:LMBR1 domain-containing protein 2 [Irineochytrium annulatum]|nr:LMBR1 domain-containing protein 2 [Irineochytrium annulatum]